MGKLLSYLGDIKILKRIADVLNVKDVKVNNVSVVNNDGDAIITVPTKTSDLTNDSGFITKAVNDLENYYLKSETYTQAEVNALIGSITTISFIVVQVLPTTDIRTDAIYLVPAQTTGTENFYDEYINLDGTTAGWEMIGTTEVDLSNYYTKTEADTLLGNKVDKVTGKGLSTNDYTTNEKNKLAGIASGAEVNVQADWNESSSSSDAYIKNKPTIPAAQVNSDWNASSGVAQILNKPTIPTIPGVVSTTADGLAPMVTDTTKYLKGDGTWGPANDARQYPTPTTDADYRVLFSSHADDTDRNSYTRKDKDFKYNPSTNNLTVGKINGNTAPTGTGTLALTSDIKTYTGTGLISVSNANVISTTAEANQNAFSNVKVGSTTIAADSKTDTLTIVAGNNITLTPDETNDKLTIAATDTTYSAGTRITISDAGVIATTAEVNQNAFSNVKVGSTTVAADSKTDTLELVQGDNITLTPDATNDKVTIAATDTKYTGTGLISISNANVISTTAEVNQNAFAKVKVGSTNIEADAKQDTLELAAGTNITLTPDATNDKVTITATDTTYTGTGLISVNASTHVISTTAEQNQNAFSNVKVGSTTVAADAKTDTLELVAGTNVTLTPDATNDKITISATDTKYTGTGLISINSSNVISTTAEANQNAFSNVKVGSTNVSADSKTDTLELVAGDNVTLTPDATNDKVTIAATDTTYESKAAASGGTAESLCTTGEKYTWNNKLNTSGGTISGSNRPILYVKDTTLDFKANNLGITANRWGRAIQFFDKNDLNAGYCSHIANYNATDSNCSSEVRVNASMYASDGTTRYQNYIGVRVGRAGAASYVFGNAAAFRRDVGFNWTKSTATITTSYANTGATTSYNELLIITNVKVVSGQYTAWVDVPINVPIAYITQERRFRAGWYQNNANGGEVEIMVQKSGSNIQAKIGTIYTNTADTQADATCTIFYR